MTCVVSAMRILARVGKADQVTASIKRRGPAIQE